MTLKGQIDNWLRQQEVGTLFTKNMIYNEVLKGECGKNWVNTALKQFERDNRIRVHKRLEPKGEILWIVR